MAKSKTAVATQQGNTMPVSADLLARIQADIQEQAEMVVPSTSNKIALNSESGKKFVFPDKSEVETFDGVVVDFATVQVLYDGPYIPGQLNSIVCYAASTKPADLAPMEGVLQPQAENCRVCPKSKFGPNSEKPECGLRKVLAIKMPGAPDLVKLDLPVLSAKQWDKYSQNVIVSADAPAYCVITKFGFDQTVKYDSPRFEMVSGIRDAKLAEEVMNRRDEARRMLLAPPNFTPVEDAPMTKGKALAAPKKRAAQVARK